MKKFLGLLISCLILSSCSDSSGLSDNEEDGGVDGNERGFDPSNFGYKISTFSSFQGEFFQIDVSDKGEVGETQFLSEQLGAMDVLPNLNSIDSSQITLFSNVTQAFYQKSLKTNEIKKFTIEGTGLAGPVEVKTSENSKFAAIVNHNEPDPIRRLAYNLGGEETFIFELSTNSCSSAEFFGNYLVAICGNNPISIYECIIYDTERDAIVFSYQSDDYIKVTIFQDKLYVFNTDDYTHKVFSIEDFQELESGEFSRQWFFDFEFGRDVIKTKTFNNQILTNIDYSIFAGGRFPAIFDIDEDRYVAGDNRVFSSQDFRNAYSELIPDISNFEGYDVDMEKKVVVLGYSLQVQISSENYPKGGVLLVDFEGNILNQIQLERAPKYIVIRE